MLHSPNLCLYLYYNMQANGQPDNNSLSPPQPSQSLYFSTDHYLMPDDKWQNKWKSTRSQSQISNRGYDLSTLKRNSTESKEDVIANQEQKIREQVRSARNDAESSLYSSSVRRCTRGLSIVDEEMQMYQPLQVSSFFGWLLLIASAISNAIVPCWMTVDINCEGLTRSAWRIFTTSLLLIPFVLYEQRHVKPAQKFINLLNRQNLQKHFIYSMNFSVYVLFGTIALKFTARSHSFSFLRLKFFFISLRKFLKKQDYLESEMGGAILVMIGMLMILWDSYNLPVEENKLAFYLSYTPWQRFFGDLLSISGSLAILYFQTNYEMPKTPRFSSLFIYNICLTINLVVFSYFFGGSQFNFHPVRGVFGLFTRQNFVSIFYVSIMLGLNLIIGNILIDKIFSEFIRNITTCFEPVITVSINHIFAIQVLTPGTAGLGLAFFVPGMMMIVGGQNYLKKQEIKIDFLIYREQQRQFFNFARSKYLSKLQNVMDEEEGFEEGNDQNQQLLDEARADAPPDIKIKYD